MKTVVALFNSMRDAELTMDDLVGTGYPREAISVVTERDVAAGDVKGRLTKIGVPETIAVRCVDGLRRGGVLEAVRVDDGQVEHVREVMSRRVPAADPENDGNGERSENLGEDEGSGIGVEPEDDDDEELVVKQARVIEEIIVRRTITTTIRDPVTYKEDEYRAHYEEKHVGSGYGFDQFEPAYHFGHEMRTGEDARFSGEEWTHVEEPARTAWEHTNPGTWETFKAAVRHAWDAARRK